MHAVVATTWGPPSVLELRKVELPEPISTEVRCRVIAAGVNPVDAKTRRGEGVARWVGPPPVILGWEFVGVVEALGYGVTRFRPGDVVFGMPWFPRAARCYAEWVTAPSRHLALVPAGTDPLTLAGLPLAGLTAWQSLIEAASVKSEDRVIILGASGTVGRLAIQLCATIGADVSAVVRTQAWTRRLHQLGAREVVPFDEVTTLRPGNLVVDLVGGIWTAEAVALAEPGGIILAIADGADAIVTNAAESRQVSVIQSLVEPDHAALETLAERVQAGSLTVDLAEALPLEKAGLAHQRIERGGVGGKILLLAESC